jgi:Uma2 family endonuclease
MTAAAVEHAGMQDHDRPWTAHDQPWTEEEFFALGETIARMELFDGSLSVSPSPNYDHQDLVLRLATVFDPAVRSNGLWIYLDVDVRLQPGRVVEPDLIIRPRVPKGTQVTEGRDIQLVCEVTSTNAATDRVLKMHYYATAGIPWYLLIEPDQPTLLLHRREGDHYVLDQKAGPGELLRFTEPIALDLDPATLTA